MEIALAVLAGASLLLLVRFREENKKLYGQIEALKIINRQLREIGNNR